jgi:hypothetical protein
LALAASLVSNAQAGEKSVCITFLGKTVVEPDREAFRKAAIPLHNDASAGAGWSQAQYDELQALK